MPKFVTIGYGDEDGYNRTPPEIRDAAHAADAELVKRGALVGAAAAPVQVRNTLAKGVQVTPGAFMTSALPLAGFAIIDAADMEDAIAQVSKSPCAIAYGVVEVWPLKSG